MNTQTNLDPIGIVERIAPPEPAGTEVARRARAALLEHIDRSMEVAAPQPQPSPAPDRRRWGRRSVALVAAAAAVIVAVLSVTSLAPSGSGVGPDRAAAAPLVRVAQQLVSQPAPPGDATVVLRTMDDGTTSADLTTDDGRYANAVDVETLRAEARGILEDPASVPYRTDVAAVRELFRSVAEASPEAAYDKAAAFIRDRYRAAGSSSADLAGVSYPNAVFVEAHDAFSATAADPVMRAGILRVLAGDPEVATAEKTVDGADRLVVTHTPAAGVRDVLELDAATGMPVVATVTTPSADGSGPFTSTTTYDVERIPLEPWMA